MFIILFFFIYKNVKIHKQKISRYTKFDIIHIIKRFIYLLEMRMGRLNLKVKTTSL